MCGVCGMCVHDIYVDVCVYLHVDVCDVYMYVHMHVGAHTYVCMFTCT